MSSAAGSSAATAFAGRTGTRRASSRSSAFLRRRSRTGSPSWGDAADGIPGIPAWARSPPARCSSGTGRSRAIPDDAASWDVVVRGRDRLAASLRGRREDAALYRRLATLRTDVPLAEASRTSRGGVRGAASSRRSAGRSGRRSCSAASRAGGKVERAAETRGSRPQGPLRLAPGARRPPPSPARARRSRRSNSPCLHGVPSGQFSSVVARSAGAGHACNLALRMQNCRAPPPPMGALARVEATSGRPRR